MHERTSRNFRPAAIVLAIAAWGCSPEEDGGMPDTGGGDNGARDDSGWVPDVADWTYPDVSDVPTDWEAEDCDEITFEIARVIPDMLIVLDRSNSMTTDGYWNPVREAIITVTSAMDYEIWFGLMMFPNSIAPNACAGLSNQCQAAHTPVVPVGEGNALTIQDTLFRISTCGGTPTALSLQNAADYMATLTTGHPQYILLATDGGPNCNGAAMDGSTCRCTGANCALNPDNCLDDGRTYGVIDVLRSAGITTYVIGIATTAFRDVMDEMAARGGTEAAYPADDSASILTAFRDIAGAVATCEFDVREPSASADPDRVNFYFDDITVPMDAACGEGWRWMDPEHTRVEFCGEYCRMILHRDVDTISARFGCQTILR